MTTRTPAGLGQGLALPLASQDLDQPSQEQAPLQDQGQGVDPRVAHGLGQDHQQDPGADQDHDPSAAPAQSQDQ